MEFAEIVARSVYGTTGYIERLQDLATIERAIQHNRPVLELFQQVLVATNYGDTEHAELASANADLWRSYLPDCVLLDLPLNRGHSIGTSDLDTTLFDHCKSLGLDWLCKGANDVYLDMRLLQIPIQEASFYYLNAVSYGALQAAGFDLASFTTDFFYPQTTFYAIDVSATDYLVDKEFLDRSWAVVGRIPDYNGRIWEHIPGWACELLLRQCAERNALARCHLMSDEQWLHVVHTVIDQHIDDCSLKGIVINGICHDPAPGQVTGPAPSAGSIP